MCSCPEDPLGLSKLSVKPLAKLGRGRRIGSRTGVRYAALLQKRSDSPNKPISIAPKKVPLPRLISRPKMEAESNYEDSLTEDDPLLKSEPQDI